MYTIIEHIEYLLTSHDCVVIPGWGALVAHYNDSHYNPACGHIECPRRELGFNASVNHNDGLLAQSLVRREGISYDVAMRFIAQSVSSFRHQLSLGNEVSLGRVGYFHSNDGLRIEFTPFYHELSNDGYFGLRPVAFRPLAEEQARTEAKIAAAAAFEQPTAHRLSWSRPLQVAASIVVLLCLTVVLTTPVIINRNHQDYASLNLPSVTKPQQQVIDMAQSSTSMTETIVTEADEPELNSSLLLDEGGKSLLVVASLTSPKQVEGYLQAHSDMASKMQVLRVSNKLYYVYVARSNNQKHLYSLQAQLPQGYGDAWVKP